MRIFRHSQLFPCCWLPVFLLLAACSGPAVTVIPALPTLTVTPPPIASATSQPSATQTAVSTLTVTDIPSTATLTPSPSLNSEGGETPLPTAATSTTATSPSQSPASWKDLPVVPALSAHARDVYQVGVVKGNNPHAFAKVGDCETDTDWFLEDFDKGVSYYSLGPYQPLQATIDFFKGSFGRKSLAARRGFNAAALLTSFWADPAQCKADESPLACEYRILRPSFALVMLGTNDVPRKDAFEENLRKVIEFSLDQSVLPVLATTADNLEGDESINATIARLAQEYDLPLWNFWAAVQPLPGHGLVEDGAHLTPAPNRFDDPVAMKSAWPWRNLTALQVLQAVWQGVQ